jgi:hypothetical protein
MKRSRSWVGIAARCRPPGSIFEISSRPNIFPFYSSSNMSSISRSSPAERGGRDEPCRPLRSARGNRPRNLAHLVECLPVLVDVARTFAYRKRNSMFGRRVSANDHYLALAVALRDVSVRARLAQRRPMHRRPIFHLEGHGLLLSRSAGLPMAKFDVPNLVCAHQYGCAHDDSSRNGVLTQKSNSRVDADRRIEMNYS